MARKRKVRAKVSSFGKPYDACREGFRRWTTYVEPESLEQVKGLSQILNKTTYEVVNDAIKEYVRKHLRR
jgi:hypothetical protein